MVNDTTDTGWPPPVHCSTRFQRASRLKSVIMPKARSVHKLEEKETGLNPDGYFQLKIPYQ